ncbi:MAG TPA: type II toxin-antitoxin system VapC family toxin [Candidatus Nanopelagicales bacterium]|nr:type II toxin-antitoxin system VapC family toxin [Candidatus Nanopelagicales bacterium]
MEVNHLAAVDRQQADIAREAYRKFGKGSGHPAGLNVGDRFTYAPAKVLDDAIICKGPDFLATDINCVDH